MELTRFCVTLPASAAIVRLQEAAAAIPMGLVAHINGQANCAKKDMNVPADQILEIFRPDFAVRVWAADRRAGLDIPIRIHVCEHAGKTWVSCRMPSVVFRPYGSNALDAIGQELDVIFTQILGALDTVRSET